MSIGTLDEWEHLFFRAQFWLNIHLTFCLSRQQIEFFLSWSLSTNLSHYFVLWCLLWSRLGVLSDSFLVHCWLDWILCCVNFCLNKASHRTLHQMKASLVLGKLLWLLKLLLLVLLLHQTRMHVLVLHGLHRESLLHRNELSIRVHKNAAFLRRLHHYWMWWEYRTTRLHLLHHKGSSLVLWRHHLMLWGHHLLWWHHLLLSVSGELDWCRHRACWSSGSHWWSVVMMRVLNWIKAVYERQTSSQRWSQWLLGLLLVVQRIPYTVWEVILSMRICFIFPIWCFMLCIWCISQRWQRYSFYFAHIAFHIWCCLCNRFTILLNLDMLYLLYGSSWFDLWTCLHNVRLH